MKRCNRCGRRKAIQSFYRCASSADGRMRHCAACQRAAARRCYARRRLVKLEANARRRALAYGCAVEHVSYADLAARAPAVCPACGEALRPHDLVEFDHVQPLALGGAHNATNIRVIHRRCNRERSIRLFVLRQLRSEA